MPTVSNDQNDIRIAKHSSVRYWFITGALGEATYRASLQILGVRGQDIDAEVALAKMERKPCLK